MLHEILLSLSGQPSPLLGHPNSSTSAESRDTEDRFPLLSAPERALLRPLARLSELHGELRRHTRQISSSHPSMICRAVSTTISVKLLGKFQQKILKVEKAILDCDASYVAGYGIVPLSTIVGEFTPWTRRLEWLWDVVGKVPDSLCTGNRLIDFLRRESQTGYVDVEEMATDLIKAAETAWMRQLSMWILYGQLPPGATVDFFIQESPSLPSLNSHRQPEFRVQADLVPNFVSPPTAASILFIGRSLNHIRTRGSLPASEEPSFSPSHMTLHSEYIRRLSALSSPISAASLSTVVAEIRMSLSQTVLSRLLPLPKIMEVLSVLHDFLLLGRGEFPMVLVSYAERRMREKSRSHNTASSSTTDTLSSLEGLSIKQGDAAVVLSQAFAELYSLQNEEDPIDDQLDLARELLNLSISTSAEPKTGPDQVPGNSSLRISRISFDDLLLATPAHLSLRLKPPLDLFLTQSDMEIYSKIHTYLLGIRRAQIRLSELWKLTALRRSQPSPWGPPLSNKRGGRERLQSARQREKRRAISMRGIWASASAVLFVLSELGSYLQGEVVNGSWSHFKDWLEGRGDRPSTSGSSRPGTASSIKTRSKDQVSKSKEDEGEAERPRRQHDPETITNSHRSYLASISQSIFLTDTKFTRSLRHLLTKADYFIALIVQLQTVQVNLDLEEDQGVVDSLANYAADEKRIWTDLQQARAELDKSVTEVITRLRDIDDSRDDVGVGLAAATTGTEEASSTTPNINNPNAEYLPWRPAGTDRLLMSLEFGSAADTRDDDDALDVGERG